MQSKINYHGKVVFQLLSKSAVKSTQTYNQGESKLFQTVALLLSGSTSTTLSIPTKLDVGYVDSTTTGGQFNSILSSLISVIASYTYEDEKHMAVFEANIRYTNIAALAELTEVPSYRNFYLRLLDSENDPMATTQVSVSSLVNIQPGTEGRVRWSMYLSN